VCGLFWAAALRQANDPGLSTHYVCRALVGTIGPSHTDYKVTTGITVGLSDGCLSF
jgi:hypothetical protein